MTESDPAAGKRDLRERPAVVPVEQEGQFRRLDQDLLPSVGVEPAAGPSGPVVPPRVEDPVGGLLRPEQVRVGRLPEMIEVQPSEDPVPVDVVALGAEEGLPPFRAGPLFLRIPYPPAHPEHPLVKLVRLLVLAQKPPEGPPLQEGLHLPVLAGANIVQQPAEPGRPPRRWGPLPP